MSIQSRDNFIKKESLFSMDYNHNKIKQNMNYFSSVLARQQQPQSTSPAISIDQIKFDKFHYVKNFNQSCLAQYLKQSVTNSTINYKNNSVLKWLQDLRMMCESECLCVLQAKSLATKLNNTKKTMNESNSNESNSLSSSPKKAHAPVITNSYESLEVILYKKDLVNEEINKFYRKIEKNNCNWQSVTNIIRRITTYIESTIDLFYNVSKSISNSKESSCLTPSQTFFAMTNKNIEQIKDSEELLILHLNIIQKTTKNSNENDKIQTKSLLDSFKSLNDFYDTFVKNFSRLCVQLQLNKIIDKDNITSISSMLNQTLEICLRKDSIKKLIIEQNGVLILFNTLKDSYYKDILDMILRALSILCSHLDSFNSLKKVDSFGILTDILCDEKAQEWTRTEAAGCIAQITSPYLEFCENLSGFLENMQDLIRSLTILCRDSSDIEIFLIGTAALANITFLDKMACEYLNQFSTAQVLIENYYLKNYNSIFVKDQITTILANMALLETCRSEIFEFNGLNLLVDFLNENPSNYMVHCASKNDSAESEISACERVQQKAAIAISRFSKEPKYASVFIELGVITRISFLCNNSNERNNSDSVLVACLAALRQLAMSSESNLVMETDIQKLIKPKIKDSVITCSSTEESYV